MSTKTRPPFREVKLTSPRQENATIGWLQAHIADRGAKYVRQMPTHGIFDRDTADELVAYLYRMGARNPLPAIGPDGLRVLWALEQGQPLPADWRARRLARMAVPFKVAQGISERSWRLLHPGAFPEAYSPAAAVPFARGYLGLRESPAGSNVVPTLVRAGYDADALPTFAEMGYAWCAYFFFLCHLRAGSATAKAALTTGTPWPLYTPTLQAYANAGKYGMRAVDLDRAPAGSGVLFDFDGGEVDHIGMLVSCTGSTVTTIDGNTSASGSQSNGGAVLLRERSRSLVRTVFTVE